MIINIDNKCDKSVLLLSEDEKIVVEPTQYKRIETECSDLSVVLKCEYSNSQIKEIKKGLVFKEISIPYLRFVFSFSTTIKTNIHFSDGQKKCHLTIYENDYYKNGSINLKSLNTNETINKISFSFVNKNQTLSVLRCFLLDLFLKYGLLILVSFTVIISSIAEWIENAKENISSEDALFFVFMLLVYIVLNIVVFYRASGFFKIYKHLKINE